MPKKKKSKPFNKFFRGYPEATEEEEMNAFLSRVGRSRKRGFI